MIDYSKTFSGRKPSQRPDEIEPFIEFLNAKRVQSYLEIGARDGDTFHAVISALPKCSRGVALDLPGGLWGRENSRDNLESAVSDLKSRGYDVSIIWGDSKALSICQMVMLRGPYDAILIDGDHTLPGVCADWENYGPMAGIVAFHDIDGENILSRAGDLVEVPSLWRELKASHETREFIGRERGMGIGIVLK